MRDFVAARARAIDEPGTVAMGEKARALRAKGVQVVDLSVGEPDFPTPEHIVEAAAKAMRDGFTHYVASRGIPELRRALADKLQRENGLTYNPDTEILVAPGGKMALYVATLGTCQAGDEVLILDPSWVSYEAIVKLADAVPVRVPLAAADHFAITPERIRPYLTPRTKAIMVNSPNNPTGRVLTDAELQTIASLAIEHDLLVFSDELYEKILYDGRRHVSLASLPGLHERTITLNGFSKAYAMTGWRLGYVAAPAPLLSQILKIYQHSATCAGSFLQVGAVAALTGPQEPIERMVAEFTKRRQVIVDGLNQVPGVSCKPVEGAFYAFADISGTGLTSAQAVDKLLTEAGVVITGGSAFGQAGEHHLRLSFANSIENIQRALDRMAEVLAPLARAR